MHLFALFRTPAITLKHFELQSSTELWTTLPTTLLLNLLQSKHLAYKASSYLLNNMHISVCATYNGRISIWCNVNGCYFRVVNRKSSQHLRRFNVLQLHDTFLYTVRQQAVGCVSQIGFSVDYTQARKLARNLKSLKRRSVFINDLDDRLIDNREGCFRASPSLHATFNSLSVRDIFPALNKSHQMFTANFQLATDRGIQGQLDLPFCAVVKIPHV